MKWIAALSGLSALIFTVAIVAVDRSWIFAAGGFWALTITLTPPALEKKFQLFSIWAFVILTVAIGLAARGIFISLEFPDPETIYRLYLLGREPDYFVKPLLILLLGIGAMTAGYLSLNKRNSLHSRVIWNERKVFQLGMAALIISLGSSILYAAHTGGFSADSISSKRTPIPGLDLEGRDFQSFGILRHLSSIAIYAHLIVLADAFRSGKRSRFLLAFALLFAACLQPFYASVRTAVAANLIFSAAVVFFIGERKSRPWFLVAFGCGIGVLVMCMTTLRSGESQSSPLESIVLNRNQIELPKTSHIINATPETLDFQYGKTLTRWLAAPIPREFWPDKPVIHPGPVIGNLIYGQKVAGVPPGAVAELWWNFAWFGVVIGAFSCGVAIRWLENRFMPFGQRDAAQTAVFIAGPMLIGYEAVGSSIGSGVFRCMLGFVFILPMLWFVKTKR